MYWNILYNLSLNVSENWCIINAIKTKTLLFSTKIIFLVFTWGKTDLKPIESQEQSKHMCSATFFIQQLIYSDCNTVQGYNLKFTILNVENFCT